MKEKILAFLLGAVCGALGIFLALPGSGEPQAQDPDQAQKKIAALEKKIASLEAQNSGLLAAKDKISSESAESSPAVRILTSNNAKFDLEEIRERISNAEEERSAQRVAAKLAILTKTLNLSEPQRVLVRELLEKREANRSDSISALMDLASSAQDGKTLEGAVSAILPGLEGNSEPDPAAFDFDTELRALLNDQQAASYDAYTVAQTQNYVEAGANRQLAQLQTTIPDLSDEQKDQAFNEFAKIAREDIASNDVPGEDSALDLQRMIRQRIAEKEAMAKILTPEQKALYDSSAATSGIRLSMPIKTINMTIDTSETQTTP